MADFGGDASCGPGNGVAGLASHLMDKDRSLNQEAFLLAENGPRSMLSPNDQAMIGNFFNEAAGPAAARHPLQHRQPPQPGLVDLVAPPIRYAPTMKNEQNWAAEFAQGQPQNARAAEAEAAEFERVFAESGMGPVVIGLPGMNAHQNFSADFVTQHLNVPHMGPKQHPPEFDTAFEREFAAVKASLENTKLDPQMEKFATEFQNVLKSQGVPDSLAEAWKSAMAPEKEKEELTTEDLEDKMEKLWQEARNEGQDPFAKFNVDEFQELVQQSWEELDKMEKMFGEDSEFNDPFDADPVNSPPPPYRFAKENEFVNHGDPFGEGLQLYKDGNLGAAALAFEAAVQRAQESGDVGLEGRAWTELGITQAENEKEAQAISASHHAVQLDNTNFRALMALAVSYTNESLNLRAYTTLERYILTSYPDLKSTLPDRKTRLTASQMHDRVTRLFLAAVRNYTDRIDSDVQMGLGVLFYLESEYDKARDCFEAVTKIKPEDWMGWNRLGATLANSGRSEEAIEAYTTALNIRPTFVRGLYNLAISCLNIGCYREAAEHLLGALSLQEKQGTESDTLWEILRRTMVLMGREDMVDKAKKGGLAQFKSEFEF